MFTGLSTEKAAVYLLLLFVYIKERSKPKGQRPAIGKERRQPENKLPETRFRRGFFFKQGEMTCRTEVYCDVPKGFFAGTRRIRMAVMARRGGIRSSSKAAYTFDPGLPTSALRGTGDFCAGGDLRAKT